MDRLEKKAIEGETNTYKNKILLQWNNTTQEHTTLKSLVPSEVYSLFKSHDYYAECTR